MLQSDANISMAARQTEKNSIPRRYAHKDIKIFFSPGKRRTIQNEFAIQNTLGILLVMTDILWRNRNFITLLKYIYVEISSKKDA